MDRRQLLVGLITTAFSAGHAWADVKIGVKITAPIPPPPVVVAPPAVVVASPPPVVVVPPPAPPPVVTAPPQVVVIPGSAVYYVPGVSFNMFVYGNRYYSYHNGVWFQSRRHSGPWRVVAVEQVPRAVRGVPPRYYRVPPGHHKRVGAPGPPAHVRPGGPPGPPPHARGGGPGRGR